MPYRIAGDIVLPLHFLFAASAVFGGASVAHDFLLRCTLPVTPSTRTLGLMMTSTTLFPQRALLLGVLWFPAAFLILYGCAALGWWSSHHMGTPLAVFFAALFLVALTLQIKVILRAIVAFRADADTHLPVNYLLLFVGVLTAVVAGGFALLFGSIALSN